MSGTAPLRRARAAPAGDAVLRALALAALRAFAEAREGGEEALGMLAPEASAALGDLDLPDAPWPETRAALERQMARARGPVAGLVARLGLDLADLLPLALAGAVEGSFAAVALVAALQAPAGLPRPTLHLALAMREALFGPAPLHGIAEGPLVAEGILSLSGEEPLPSRCLAVRPELWAVLCGRRPRWPGCRELPAAEEALVPAAIRREVPALAALVAGGQVATLVLRGASGSGRAGLAALLAAACGLRALAVQAETWRGDPALAAACPHAGWLPVLQARLGPGEVFEPAPGRAQAGPLCVLTGQDGTVAGPRVLEIALPRPEPAERQALWARHVADPALAAELAAAVRLGGADLAAVADTARLLALRHGETLGRAHVAAARQGLGADRLSQLAHPVRRQVGRDSLVLAPGLREELEALVSRCRRREALWQGLGATLQATVSPGVRALFAGESGTGKTLAASYLASELGAPLYRCDIAAVMNKYVGESEKNLGQLLDEAEARDVVLLFDEAEALFGRRTDGSETGERYANMLTNFLLTRIEAHGGIVVLTTNSRMRLDTAFMRRLDMVLTFPAASYEERLALWHSHLGARAPVEEVLRLLAGWCDLSGGSIRNVVLAAAAAVPDGARIGLADLLPGLAREYRKNGRSMPPEVAAQAGQQGGGA